MINLRNLSAKAEQAHHQARLSAFLDQALKNSEGACSGGNQVGERYMRIDQKANGGDQQDEPTGNRHNLSHAGRDLDKSLQAA